MLHLISIPFYMSASSYLPCTRVPHLHQSTHPPYISVPPYFRSPPYNHSLYISVPTYNSAFLLLLERPPYISAPLTSVCPLPLTSVCPSTSMILAAQGGPSLRQCSCSNRTDLSAALITVGCCRSRLCACVLCMDLLTKLPFSPGDLPAIFLHQVLLAQDLATPTTLQAVPGDKPLKMPACRADTGGEGAHMHLSCRLPHPFASPELLKTNHWCCV